MPFTIAKLLESDLRGLRLVAGKPSADNVILNVNVIENPDSYDWFQPGDFLLTTGYIFRDDPKGQVDLVRKLRKLGCAGLGIKIKRYWPEIPPAMITEAERLELPLIEFPVDYTLAQISNYVNNELRVREDSIIRQHMRIHEMLLNSTLSGGSLKDIVMQLVELVGNPILVLDDAWQLLEYAETGSERVPLEKLFLLAKSQAPFPTEFMETLPRDAASFRKSIYRTIQVGSEEFPLMILPVRIEYTTYGYIVCPMLNRDLGHLDYIALEQAVTVVALERSKAQQFEEYKRMIRYDFFEDLLEGRIESAKAGQHLAELHGMSADRPHLVIVIKVQALKEQTIADMVAKQVLLGQVMRRMTQEVHEACQDKGRHVTVFQRGHKIVLFLQLFQDEHEQFSTGPIKDLILAIQSRIMKMSERPKTLIGVGRVAEEISELSRGYHEACEAMRIQEGFSDSTAIAWYENLMVYQLLESGVPQSFLEDFYRRTVGRLEAYDRENESNLTEALQAYIAADGNISQAADRLFMHRNTMLYRVKKIEEVLQSDLKDWNQMLELQLGFYIAQLLKKK
ncbi:MAG: PucR family transcriptional regulator ligand-binding domain-containing protein [Eubacteriales bacterium]|nr:PucR family transcriptional regulator ligand-binding domain-containing protein [Eubacteriales bacterium]